MMYRTCVLTDANGTVLMYLKEFDLTNFEEDGVKGSEIKQVYGYPMPAGTQTTTAALYPRGTAVRGRLAVAYLKGKHVGVHELGCHVYKSEETLGDLCHHSGYEFPEAVLDKPYELRLELRSCSFTKETR